MNAKNRILAVYAALVACELVQDMPPDWRQQMSNLLDAMTDYDSPLHRMSETEVKKAVDELAANPNSFGCYHDETT